MAGVVGNVVAGIGQAGQAAQQNAPATEQQEQPRRQRQLPRDRHHGGSSLLRAGRAGRCHAFLFRNARRYRKHGSYDLEAGDLSNYNQ